MEDIIPQISNIEGRRTEQLFILAAGVPWG